MALMYRDRFMDGCWPGAGRDGWRASGWADERERVEPADRVDPTDDPPADTTEPLWTDRSSTVGREACAPVRERG